MKLVHKKTGDIDEFYLEDDINVDTGEHWISVIRTHKHHDMTNSWHFRTLKELYDSFEDYEPKEPLIKDEEVRKAVRAWAYLASVGEDKVLYHIVATKKEFEYYGNCLRFGSFDTYIGNIEDKTYYTIDELCGEEE